MTNSYQSASNSPTRVVHSRIDEETLLCVVDFFESRGGDTSTPLSTRVSVVLATLMRHLQEQGDIPTYDSPADIAAELHTRLQKPSLSGEINLSGPKKLYQPVAEGPADTPNSERSESPSLAEQIGDSPDPRSRLRDLIDEGVARVTQPEAELDPDIWAPDPTELPDPGEFTLDVESQQLLPEAELPDDHRLVVKAHSENDQALLLALRIVLQLVEQDLWHEPETEKVVRQVLPHTKAYLEDVAMHNEQS